MILSSMIQGVSKNVYSWKLFAKRTSGQNLRKLSVSLEGLTPFGTSSTKMFLHVFARLEMRYYKAL